METILRFFVVINQINKHTVKIFNHCAYTQIIIKKFHPSNITKTNIFVLNIRMINLSFDELRLIAQIRNISDYENFILSIILRPVSPT